MGSSASSGSCKPHGSIDDLFLSNVPATPRQSWLATIFGSSSSNTCTAAVDIGNVRQNRISKVKKVYWCSDPLNEAGDLKDFSPRTPPRWLAWRKHRGLNGPATWEIRHSYVLVDVETSPLDVAGGHPMEERYRLNWGQGKKHGTNLTIVQQSDVPPYRLQGERLEDMWPGTCTGDELLALLKKWDGQKYDVNPVNNRNCHHFVQDVIQKCTQECAY